MAKRTFKIYRYDPDKDAKPYMQTIEVELDGSDVSTLSRRRFAQSVGLLPQHPSAPDGLTVAELVSRGRHPHRGVFQRWSADDTARVDDAMAKTGVTALADRPGVFPRPSAFQGTRESPWLVGTAGL